MLFRFLLWFIIQTGVIGLVIVSPSQETIPHTISTFGIHYGNISIIGNVIKSVPFDACQPLQVNATNRIVLAVRGGSPACSFITKVKNIELAGAKAGIIMNADRSLFLSDDLIEMGSMQKNSSNSITSIYITHESGKRLLSLLDNQSLTVSLNSTGEVLLSSPSFLDMVISFLQLSVVIWISIALMYGIAYCGSLWKVYKRHRIIQSIQTVPFHKQKEDEPVECSICLEDFKENDLVKVLPCKHVFHEHCAKGWIVNIRGVCPLCRQGIFPKQEDNLSEQSLNRELSDLVDREALRTHSRTLIYLFLIIYVFFIVASIFFP